ncbi:MAG: helix-turn-helix transcriptional regulator [Clostridia bacterium]|nr:helix-turn-helix transcriptional regulator [Clostridia bacterium]
MFRRRDYYHGERAKWARGDKEKILFHMERLHYTQRMLSKLSGVSEPTLRRLINTDNRVREDCVELVAAALDVEPEEIVKWN